ncbi:MAG: hypothetical protein KC731_30545 [Myxococcales bacterium]|nr:hypothetical protein [Myxococcales bacterium]
MRDRSLVLSSLLLVACGGEPSTNPSPDDPDVVTFSAELTVDAAEETFVCKFVTMPEDRGPMAVSDMRHHYTEGSHHFLLFRTDIASPADIPEGGDQLTPCEEGDRTWMQHVRGVVYAAQDPEGTFAFPDGVGMTFEPGAVMLMQSHYLNATTEPLDARIDLDVTLAEPSSIEEEAGVLFFYNPQIAIGAMGKSSASLNCPVESDVNLAFVASHMHKRGSAFEATTDDPVATERLGGALYETTDWAEPVPRVFDGPEPLTVSAGSTLRYTCDFDNPDPFTVVQGPSAEVNEMCMLVGMYWPKAEPSFEWCYDGVTDGTGTASAADTLVCLVVCGNDAECQGGCWDNACPNAPMKVSQVRDCLPDCIGECSAGLQSAACDSCASARCPDEWAEFMSATCQ